MVKIKLEKEDLDFTVTSLVATTDGNTDSVYIVDKKYILKVFEKADKVSVNQEIQLLALLNGLPVPMVIGKVFCIKNRPALLYSKLKGKSVKKATKKQIKEIALFLKRFHKITYGKTTKNRDIFDKKRVEKLVIASKDEKLICAYNSLHVELQNDGIIHGDLFLDNVLFEKDKLSAVIDFIDACCGDFIFELAVVAFSWDLKNSDLEVLISNYDEDINRQKFKDYIKYALICYCSFRASVGRNYEDLIEKLEKL
jgi:homoserine kinase type II